MQITRCDHCGTEVPKQGLARLQGWAGVQLAERVRHETHAHIEQTRKSSYELCDACLPDLKAFLKGTAGAIGGQR